MKKTITKQIRIPFTLEALKNPNAQFVMRNGTPVENNALNFLPDYYEHYSIRGLFDDKDGLDLYELWTKDGKYNSMLQEHPKDLLEIIEIEVEVDEVKRLEFNRNEFEHIVFFLQSVQDSFGDRKFFPEDSELKTSYNQQLQTWIDSAEALQKKIIYQHWTTLPVPPDEVYGSLTDEYLQHLTNQNK